jgi:GNAT superfamily N-acetyltransferase
MDDFTVRFAEASDYQPVIAVLNDWWGGRKMSDMLPKLFFIHFRDTSLVAEKDGTIVGFLVGFKSQTHPEQAYIHFIGVHPDYRGRGLARKLYGRFMNIVRQYGCRTVHAVTAPINKTSIAFHRHMGFTMEAGDKIVGGIPVAENYDGQGGDRVLFVKHLVAVNSQQ